MSDTVYRVLIDYELRGDVDRPIARATGKLGELDRANRNVGSALSNLGGKLASFGGAVAEAFTSAVERVGSLGAAVAGMGVVAAFAGITYGATHLNSELEQTNLSLAAIFQAQGYTANFTDAMSLAADEVGKMKQDVKSLPGDLGQLAAIMKTIATPGAQAGLSPDAIRQLSGRAMLVGGIEQLPPELVARELAQLLSGRAGAHNILGTRLGLIGARAQSFNAESASQRAADVGKEFDRFGPAADAFGRSFFANWTTFKDAVKYTLLAPVTSPLFESIKRTVVEVNTWFEENKVEVSVWAEYIGGRLAGAFEWGKAKVLEWWPAMEAFASQAYGRLVGLWKELEPIVGHVAESIKQSLGDGSALDRVESILKLYGVLKVGQMAAPFASGAFSVGKAAVGLFGEGAGAAGAGGALAAGEGAGGLLAAAAPLAIALGAVAAAAYGANEALDDTSFAFHTTAFDLWTDAKGKMSEATDELSIRFRDVSENVGGLLKPALEDAGMVALGAVDLWANAMKFGVDHIDLFAAQLGATLGPLGTFMSLLLTPHLHTAADTFTSNRDYELSPGTFVKAMSDSFADTQKKLAPKPGAGGGGGGTHIQKVEIVVSTNEEPSRIARRVVDMIADIGRHPTASRYAHNFSRART